MSHKKLPKCYGTFPRISTKLQTDRGCPACHKLQTCTMKTKKGKA